MKPQNLPSANWSFGATFTDNVGVWRYAGNDEWVLIERRAMVIPTAAGAPMVASSNVGGTTVTTYVYKAGDVLAEHTHDEATEHYTLVLEGRVVHITPRGQSEHGPGELVDWGHGEPHSFRAITDARTVAIVKKSSGG